MRVKIEALEKARRISAWLAGAREYERQDDRPSALQNYSSILSEDAASQEAVNEQDKAHKIISANNRSVSLLNNQNRMQDQKIYERIVEFVEQIRPLAGDSKTLAGTLRTLESVMDMWQRKKTVLVVSDGKSEVQVRRVGRVGKVKKKEIQLKPGTYEFECFRPGFRSKIVEHFVPPGQTGIACFIATFSKITITGR